MVARAAALQVNINIDGRPLPTKKRWRTSSKACAPRLLHACAPQFHLPVNYCRESRGSGHEYHRSHAFPLLRSNAHLSVSPSSVGLSPISE